MKRFHNFIFTGCVFLLIAVSIFISSCQVGLGGTVDYKAPTVTITSHTSGNSVLNGTTEFSGTWEDDTGVTEIDFTLSKYLKDSQTYEEVDTFKISIPSAETEKKSGSWSYEFDTTKYPETDYQLAIVATDTSKTKSQQQILAFSIDNTAPLITLDKPNSLNFNDPALFGREVKISGYIEDAHSIKSLDVKVFKANADGSKGEEITLPKSSFSVSSGALTKYIARYYSDDARADLSDEELLTYENYVAIYGDKNSSNWNKNQNYIFEISATDKVGNVTDKLYLNDNLKSLIKAATDKDIELSTTEMRNILEDNYTDNALTESQVAVVKEILKGTYDQSSLSETYTYLVNNEDSLYGTINSRANPTYTANGCILGESTWGQVSSGGTLSFTVNSGSDGAYFKPNVINLALYPCDEDGNIIDKVDGTTIYRKIEVPQDYIKNSNNKSIKDLETTVNTGSYSFSLTDMSDSEGDSLFKAGEYYKIEVTGYDLKNNDIIASFDSDDNEYEFGFKVIASNAMPEVTFANDKEFVKAEGIANTIPVTISVSKAKKVVVSAYAQTKEGKCTFGDAIVTEGTKVIDSKEYALTDGVVTVNVPLNFDVTKLERGKNWTIGIYIVATNIDATKYETFYVYADDAAPEVAFKGKLLTAQKNNYEIGLITEADSLYEKDEKGNCTYTYTGTWSDIGGSGTDILYYSTDNGKTWSEFDSDEAPQATSKLGWTKALPVTEGGPYTLSFKAEDSVGNPSDVITFTGIKFDFALPEVKITSGTVADYYKEGDTPEFTVEATDTNKISALNLTVTKDGATVAADDYATAGITVKETTTDNKITKVITLTEDGSWNITAQAVDSTKRESSTPEKISTIFDTKKPVWKEDKDFVPKVGGNPYTTATWYNSTSLQFSGYYTEEGSGISYIEYELYEAGSDVAKTSSTFTTSDKGSYESFEATLSGFIASNSANKVVFTPVDKAGNRGDSKEFEIHVDCSSPTISVDSSSQGNKYAQQNEPITLTGTISDDASGFNSGSVKVKVGNITESAVNVIVDTSSEGYSSTNAKWTATIPTSVLSSLTENEQTVVTVYVSDAATNTSSTTACTIIIDTKKPEISFKNRLGKAVSSGVQSDGTYKVGLITKSDSLNYDSENKKFTYEISGDWTDNKGSGTKLLEYCIDGGDWKKFNETEAPVSSGKTNWSKTLEVKESKKDEAMTLAFRATDGAGLVSDIVTFTDIRFDYESPALSVDKSEIYNYYTADTGAPEFTITAEDTNAIESFEITVTKDGVEVSSGDGYTLVKDTTSTTTQTAKITVSEEAKWSVKTNVADCQGQKSEPDTIAFVYDKTAPAWTDEGDTYYTTVGGKKYDSTNPWYKESAMNFKGYVDEAGSGIEKIVWTLTSASGSSDSGEIVATKVDGTDKYSYTQAISGFVSGTGENKVTLIPYDKAGNDGTPKEFSIYVDNEAPEVTVSGNTSKYTDASAAYVLSGTVTDKASGFGDDAVTVKVGSTAVDVTLNKAADGLSATWTATVPASVLSALTEGTKATVTVTVTDKAGNPKSDKNSAIIKDTTAPVINFKNKLGTSVSSGAQSDGTYKVGLITESDSMFKLTDGKYTYEVSGDWTDNGGSGTKTFEYRVNDGEWTSVDSSQAPTSANKTNWSTTIKVSETKAATPMTLSFKATDEVGLSETVEFTGIYFDYAKPTVTITPATTGYVTEETTYTITAEDTNELKNFNVVLTKNGATATSGYTLTDDSSSTANKKIKTLVITEEGKWNIQADATDGQNRSADKVIQTLTYDKTAPAWTGTPTVGDKAWDSTAKNWYSSSALTFKDSLTEEVSGMDRIDYVITDANGNSKTGSVVPSEGTNGAYTYETTLSGFASGSSANTVTFTPYDNAGNPGTERKFSIYVDKNAPTFSFTKESPQYIKGSTNVTLTGSVEDDASGLASDAVKVKISGTTTEKTATLAYDDSSDNKKATWTVTFDSTELNTSSANNFVITVTDVSGNSNPDQKLCTYYVDSTAPVITFKGDLLKAQSSSNKVGLITEDNASLSTSAKTFTVSGTWTDGNGNVSGTGKLYYKYGDNDWAELTEAENSTNWSKAIAIDEGTTAKSLSFYAVDAIGNGSESDAVTFTDLTFDFAAPTVSVAETVKEYYKSGETPSFTITATDTNKISALNLTVTKDGKAVAEADYADSGITVEPTTSDTEITKVVTLTSDGIWNISAQAKDAVNRDSTAVAINTTVDTVAPAWTGTPTVGDKAWDSPAKNWYSSSALTFKDSLTEDVSGMDRIDYVITAANGNSKTGSVVPSETNGAYSYETTLSGFVSGTNTVKLTPYDKAGNDGTPKEFSIYVDNGTPELTVTGNLDKYTKATEAYKLEGTVTDEASGFGDDAVTVKVGSTAVDVTLNKAADGLSANWTASVPASVLSALTEKTKAIVTVTVTDKAGNPKSDKNSAIIKDTTAPALNFKGDLLKAQSNGNAVGWITEDKLSKDSSGSYTYTVSGSWSDGDSNVSGTGKLYYKYGDADWAELTEAENSTNWSKSIAISAENADAKTLSFYAVDAIGNGSESDAVTFTDLKFDWSAPTVSVAETVKDYYKSGETPTFTITAEDTTKISALNLTITKGGVTVAEADYADSGITVTTSTTNTKITKVVKLASDGIWNISAQAKDEAGHSTTSAVVSTIIDTTAPVITFNNGDLSNAVITEEKLSKLSSGKYSYTLSGSWSDVNGSGTSKLYYKFADSASLDSTTWTDLTTAEAPTAASAMNWSKAIEVTEGTTEKTLVFYAEDAAGNKTSETKYTGIKFDFAAPTVSVAETVKEYYKKDETPSFTITATDTNKISALNLTITKDGKAVAEADYADSGITVATTTSDTEIKKVVTLTSDGIWNISAQAKDAVKRDSPAVAINTTVDTVAPAWTDEGTTYYTTVGGKKYDSTNPWYKESAMNFKGYVDEAGSGIEKIVWTLTPASGSSDSGEIVATKVDGTDKYSYTQAISGFVSGTNTVTLTLVDKAGNEGGTSKEFTIKVDNTSPVIGTADVSGTMYTKADSDISISGTITDTNGSGFTAGVGNVVVNLKVGETVTTVNASVDATGTSAKWTATIPADDLSKTAATEITLSVKDNAGNPADQKLCTYYVDTTAPALNFKGDLLTAQSNSNKVGLITENNAAVSYDKTNNKYTYTLNGSWSDIGGSKTKTLHYKFAEPAKLDSTTWKDLTTTEAPQSDTLSNWSTTIDVTESTVAKSLSFYAEDAAGNPTDEVTFTDLTFDFSVPTISITDTVADYYNKTPTFTITAVDGNEFNVDDALTVTATKDGSTVTSGYTLTKVISTDKKTVTGTLILNDEGKWSITVSAKDAAGRTSTQTVNINTTVDKTAPTWLEDSTHTPTVGGKDWNTNTEATENHSWFKSSSLKFEGYFTESGSGIKEIKWSLTPAGASTATKGTITASDKGTYEAFATTIDGFTAGENTITFTPVDYAGNEPATGKQFTIYIDDVAPDYSLTDSTAILTNKVTPVTLTGTATDANSGIDSVIVSITGITDASVTAILTDGSSTGEKNWSAEFNKTVLAKLEDGKSYSIKVTVEDKAENEVSTTATSISVDTTAPVVTISTPVSTTSLNGNHALSGKVTETSPKSLELYWSTTNDTTLKTDGTLDTAIWTKFHSATELSGIYNWTTSSLNFTDISKAKSADDGKATVYILPVAKDSAGNCNIYTYDGTTYTSNIADQRIAYTVDMNTDRPVIKFNELEKVSGTLRKYTNQISGTLSDDDTVTAFKIYATTDSADTGIPKTLAEWNSYTQEGKLDWTANSSTTSFTYEPNHITKDGTIYVYFFVTDSEGDSFFTGATSTLSQPYVMYKGTTANVDNSAVITYTTDSKQPQISSKAYYAGDDEDAVNAAATSDAEEIKTTAITIGGAKKKFIKFIVTASDDNGIKSVTGKVNSVELTFTKQSSTETTTTSTWISKAVSVASVTSGQYTAEITVTDNSDLTYPDTISVTVDNDGPEFGKINPSMTAVQVGEVSVSGFLSDKYSSVSTLKYLIGTDTVIGYDDDTIYSTAMADNTQYNAGSVEAFEFDFDNSEGSGESTHTGYKNPKLPTTVAELASYTQSTTDNQIYDIPIYFVAEDELGNYTVYKDFYVHYNPYADRPTTEILYPSNGATLSGQIRLSGSAVDNEEVGSVYYQIMPTSSSTYTTWKAAKAWATSLGLTVVDSSSTELSGGNFDADSDFWGIKATNTVSWYANLNDEVSLIKDECKDADSKNYLITVRAVAIDAKKTLGNWSNVVNIVLNPDAPAFGSIEAATLKQFADSVTNFTTATATSSLEISGTTYLKGQWYYVTTVTHTNGIKEISYSLDDSSSVALVKAKTIQNSNTVKAIGGESDNYSGYQIWIPLGTDSGSGTKTLTVSATTGNDVSGQKTEVFTYDNEAPEIGSLYHTDVDTEFTAGAVLTNNNNQLVIGGTVDDTTAGIDKVLFYFYREGTDTIELAKRIYDPMFNNYDATSKAKSEILTSTLSSEDITTSIPLYGITQTVNVGQDSKTLTLATESDHIRAGGLAKINGIYYTISKVDGTTVTLKTSCGVTGSLSAFFPIAQVVDNTSAEKVSKFTTDAITFTGNTDDGDGMPESLTGTGTTKTWEASIHGNWLPDGPVTLVVIAFDKSGNASATSINASIQNNRPRLSKVFLGTNLDGSTDNDNATYSDNEFETYNILAAEGAYQEVYELTTYNYNKYAANGTKINSTRSAFIAKNKLAVVPEFVGGNGEIKVIFNNADTTTDADGKMTNEDVSTGGAGPVYALAAKKGTLSGTEVSGDYFEFGTELGDDADSHAVSFTFWDSTELTTPGTDSQYSFLRIKDLKVAQTDSTAPNVVVNPFFWEGTGKGKNSLYEGSTSNGHIELEDDWMATDAYDKTTSGEYDGDPKVSGKIVLRGTAYDDRAFAGLYFKVTNSSGISVFTATGTTTEELSGTNYYLGATYANSTWTSKSSDLATNGWAMTIDSADNAADETYNYFGQNGHKVHWELALDTEKITGVAATDITVTVAAVDTKSNNSTGRAASDATDDATAHKPGYKMDVVPYITSLDTVLTDLEATNPSVYGRTALGKYPVYYYRKTTSGSTNAESFYVKGFNLSKGTVTFKSASTATDILDDNNAVSVPATAKSGEISVTVNGVQSLNNVNNDNAKGNYSGEYTDDDYAYCYNRQPNGQNNNNLTDNVELAIWDINSKAAVAKAGELSEVVMHVNPANGMLGFAFAHSQDLASYPNGTTSSYQTWITDWTGINQIGFTFDQTGRMFGTNGGTDTYTPSSKAGRFGLISSDWGTITTVSASDDSLSGYTNKNRLRLEYLGIKRNGTYASYSNRFAKGDCSQFATVVPASNSNVTNLYMMYYDNVLGQLKFKAGQYSKTSGWNWTGFAQGGNSFGDFVDDAYNEHCKDNSTAYNPNYSNLSIVSTVAAGANGNENATPGAYYSIAAVPSADGKSDVVVAVWYDVTHKNLWYSYIKNPLDNAGKRTSSGIYDADTYVSSEWAEPKLILDKTSKITGGAGGYCAIAVDEDKHVHIAAYGAKGAGRLYYVYLDTYDAKFDSTKNIVQVDSYGSTGQYITMEVAKDSNGKNIPYIGFWMNSMSYPKYTYLVDTDSATDDGSYYPKAGTDANSMYTGAWESIMLPTSSEVLLDDINIGVYRYLADDATSGAKKGQIREIPALTRETCGDTKGNAGGNGTANPILGYGISEIGSGYVETAQLK